MLGDSRTKALMGSVMRVQAQHLATPRVARALPQLVAAGCTDDGRGADPDPDLELAATAARTEKVAVDTFTAMRSMAVQGRLGAAVPQEVVEFSAIATGHHQEHLNAWNLALTGGGPGAVDAPDPQAPTDRGRSHGPPRRHPRSRQAGPPHRGPRLSDLPRGHPDPEEPGRCSHRGPDSGGRPQHQAVLRYILGLYPVGSAVARDPTDFAPADRGPELVTG